MTWFFPFFQLFPLLLDCLTFGFSYSPLLQLSMLCRTIVWNAIVLGGNKKGGKLSGGNYVKAIYLGSIIQGQFSRWQRFEGNYQWSIILRGNSLGANFWGAIIRGAINRGQLSWGQLSRRNLSFGGGGQLFGGNYLRGSCPGGNCPVPDLRVISWFATSSANSGHYEINSLRHRATKVWYMIPNDMNYIRFNNIFKNNPEKDLRNHIGAIAYLCLKHTSAR